jgi:hypothetical protein
VGNLIVWLFTDPTQAGTNGNLPGPEPFHYSLPWLIFCLLGLLIYFYYMVEGRKRFVKSRPILKYMLDRYLGWFAVICFVGLPILASRIYLNNFFFAWRAWRYLWLVALGVWLVWWILYLVRRYPEDVANHTAYINRQQYIPKGSKKKARTATR